MRIIYEQPCWWYRPFQSHVPVLYTVMDMILGGFLRLIQLAGSHVGKHINVIWLQNCRLLCLQAIKHQGPALSKLKGFKLVASKDEVTSDIPLKTATSSDNSDINNLQHMLFYFHMHDNVSIIINAWILRTVFGGQQQKHISRLKLSVFSIAMPIV